MTIDYDQLALEVAEQCGIMWCEGSLDGSGIVAGEAKKFARRYRAALKEKMKPMAHIHRTGSNVIECIYKGALCPADGHQLLSNDLPLNKSVPLYSLEGW